MATDQSAGVYDLARVHGVAITAACRKARIAPSTPARWRKGARPRAGQVSALRAAIVQLARSQGTHAEVLNSAVADRLRSVIADATAALAIVEQVAGSRS